MSDQSRPRLPLSQRTKKGVVGVVWHQEKLLVIRRALHVSAPGMLCFPGGGIEEGETEEQALVRELNEEVAAIVTPVRCVWRSVTRWGVDLAWWLADLHNHPEVAPNPDEVHSIHWHTPLEMTQLQNLLHSNREFLELASRGAITIQ
jgi:8-oxo-dGTP diphosphatase